MSAILYRSAYAIGVLALTPAVASADAPPEAQASMQCDRASEAGRVRCTVEARVTGQRTITWADVEILSLPDFASALKGRIGPQDALSRDAVSAKWALGLVARRAGQGEVRGRVRVVLCDPVRPGAPPNEPRAHCAPLVVEVQAQVTVG
jgi:hypothetical protein